MILEGSEKFYRIGHKVYLNWNCAILTALMRSLRDLPVLSRASGVVRERA